MVAKIAETARRKRPNRRPKIGGAFPSKTTGGHAPGRLTPVLKSDFAAAIQSFRKTFGLSQEELARVTGFSTRSIAGWESGPMFSSAGRKKLVETQRLCAALAQIMPSDTIGDWLREPNAAFENQPPLQIIERGETDRLWRMIFQIDAQVAN